MPAFAAVAPYLASAIPAIAGVAGSKQQANATQAAAQATAPHPYSSGSSYGTAGFNPQTGQLQLQQANNPFSSLFTTGGLSGLANAYSAPGQAYYGAPQEVQQALQGTFDPSQMAQQRLDMLRQQAAPANNQQALSLKDKLFSLGQLGSTSGAAGQQAFLNAANQQDLGFQQSAQDYANQQAQQRFENAIRTTGVGADLANQNFQTGLQSNTALSGQFQNLLAQANAGAAAGGGQNPAAALASAQASGVPYQAAAQYLIPGLSNLASGQKWGGGLSEIKPVAYNPH